MNFEHIFKPIQIGPKRAKNRIEIAPAAPFLTGHDGSLSPEFYAYNEALASTGAGIVTLGVTPVDPVLGVSARCMSIGTDLFASDFEELAGLFHSYGALASAEIVYTRYMLTPAEIVVNETSTEEVEDMIRCWADGAERLMRYGFDICFIHGGHGNVPAMFFNAKINRRTDRFGGSFEGRCQFAVELLGAIRERIGNSMAIEYRLSAEEILPGMTTFEETLEFAKVIEPYIDLLHVSRGLLEVDELVHFINPPLYLPRALNLPFAARFKAELSIPVTVVGAIDFEAAEEAIGSGQVDMVSMIRNVLPDSHCVEKLRLGQAQDVRPCLRCNTCIDRTHTHQFAIRCAVNPLVGRESRFHIDRVATSKKVAVVGGGPAGLQAARTLAMRGHEPHVFEKTDKLGGLLRIAAADPGKPEIARYLAWLEHDATANPDIEIHFNTTATPEMLAEQGFEAAIIACGGTPRTPAFADDGRVFWVGDVEGDADKLGKRVAVIGGGVTGMECALSLARAGHEVHIVHPHAKEEMGKGSTAISLRCLHQLLEELGVTYHCDQRAVEMADEGVVLRDTQGQLETLPCDSVVHALGFVFDEELLASFEAAIPASYRAGDCNGFQATVFNAVSSGFDIAMRI